MSADSTQRKLAMDVGECAMFTWPVQTHVAIIAAESQGALRRASIHCPESVVVTEGTEDYVRSLSENVRSLRTYGP